MKTVIGNLTHSSTWSLSPNDLRSLFRDFTFPVIQGPLPPGQFHLEVMMDRSPCLYMISIIITACIAACLDIVGTVCVSLLAIVII